MRVTFFIYLAVGIASTFSLDCRSHAQDAPVQAASPAKTIVALSQYSFTAGIPKPGVRPDNTICVVVSGQVNRPDVYFLAPDATVSDAVRAAGGIGRLATWSVSFLLRPINALQAEKITLAAPHKPPHEEIALQEGDRVYLGLIED